MTEQIPRDPDSIDLDSPSYTEHLLRYGALAGGGTNPTRYTGVSPDELDRRLDIQNRLMHAVAESATPPPDVDLWVKVVALVQDLAEILATIPKDES